MSAAFRIARRELRGGLAGFRVFLACLALGVAAIAAVGSVRAAIQAGLTREAASLLGGDAEMEFTYRFASPEERAWMAAQAEAVSEIADFRSMATYEAPGADAGPQRVLVQVKAVDAAYPLTGTVGLAGGGDLAAALAPRDGLPALVAEGALLDRLGIAPGARLRLGSREFVVGGRLEREPDAALSGMTFGPRVILRLSDLEGSGLLAPGSLYNSAYRLRLAPGADLAALRADAVGRFEATGLRWSDRRNGAPGTARFVDRLGSFLVLMGLAGLAVGGVGVSAAVRAYLDGKTETIATLKTLGASGGTIFAVYLMLIGALAAVGVAIGLALGAVLPLAAAPLVQGRLPVPIDIGLYPRPLVEAAAYGLLTALIFALWPLARARDVRAASLFRGWAESGRRLPRPAYLAALGGLAAALVALAAALSAQPEIALAMAVGVAGSLAALWLAAAGFRRLARRAAPLARGWPSLRLALGAVGGPGGETASVVMSLGLGLGVLAAVGQADWNLRNLLTADLPERAPAFFFVDIQTDQLPEFLDIAGETPGVGAAETAPMLRGIISRINDRPAREVAPGHWAVRGDRGITYAAAPPAGTEIVAGDWWPEDYAGPPLVSFAAEEAEEMGLKLGDRITLNVLGRELTATVASLRRVDFQDMGINFLMILDPAALAGAPHSHIATVYAEPAAEGPLLRAVADAYPNVTAVGVREAIGRVAESLDGLSLATRWAAAATLATGAIVLIGAAAAGERARIREGAVLKVLGATRGRILASFALRSALTGAAAGAVAIVAGGVGGWWVTTQVLDGPFRFEPVSALAIVIGGALASLLAGLAFALRPLAAKPARVLRSQE